MKPMHSFLLLSLFFILSLMLTPRLLLANAQPWDEQEAERNAQEEITSEERSAQEEMGSSIYGRITSIDLNAKVMSLLPTDEVEDKEEEDDDDDASQDYHFKSDTTLTGIDELSDLAPGDYVTLEYYTFRDKNRVTEISFDKHEENENEASNAKEFSPGVLVG
jgi:PDZ domain-containing secreted protein